MLRRLEHGYIGGFAVYDEDGRLLASLVELVVVALQELHVNQLSPQEWSHEGEVCTEGEVRAVLAVVVSPGWNTNLCSNRPFANIPHG